MLTMVGVFLLLHYYDLGYCCPWLEGGHAAVKLPHNPLLFAVC